MKLVIATTVAFVVWGGAARADSIAVFDNPSFVDTTGGPTAESDTVQASLSSLGHSVNTFTGYNAAAWTAAGDANDLILIPKLEKGDLNAAMSAADRAALAGYVSGGGGLIVMGHFTRDISLLNAVFGYSLVGATPVSKTKLDATEAAGTVFAGGAAELPGYSAMSAVYRTSLPVGALDLYSNSNQGKNSVFAVDFGSGRVMHLGWNWYNAAPLGTNDGGWISVLGASVQHVSSASSAPVPEPGAFLLFGVAALGYGVYRRRRKAS